MLVRIGPDQAGIDREAFAADQPLRDAAPHGRLEQLTQEIAVAESAMPVLRESRVAGHIALEPEPAEPAIGEVQMHFLAKGSLRADAEAIGALLSTITPREDNIVLRDYLIISH